MILCVIVNTCGLSSATRSSTAVTITVCAVFQFALVKTNCVGVTEKICVESKLVIEIVTLEFGWVARTKS